MTDTQRNPQPVDLHVGARIRARRKQISISQETLAGALDLTFQQVQRYERGSNRVSSSKLYEIAKTLRVGIAYFFEGLVDPTVGKIGEDSGALPAVHAFLMTSEGLGLAEAFPKIPARQRGRLLGLVRAMAAEEDADDEPVAPSLRVAA